MRASNRDKEIDQRPLLVLDIDETLLHAAAQRLGRHCDYKTERMWIYKRPHVDDFLYYCKEYFRLAVWTSARASFAEEVFSRIFSYLSLQFIYSQHHCLTMVDDKGQKNSVKPVNTLHRLGFDLKRVLVVDDSPEKHCLNPDNLIAVKPYYAEVEDDELYLLKNYLHRIKDHNDYLSLRKRQWHHSHFDFSE